MARTIELKYFRDKSKKKQETKYVITATLRKFVRKRIKEPKNLFTKPSRSNTPTATYKGQETTMRHYAALWISKSLIRHFFENAVCHKFAVLLDLLMKNDQLVSFIFPTRSNILVWSTDYYQRQLKVLSTCEPQRKERIVCSMRKEIIAMKHDVTFPYWNLYLTLG